MMDLLLAVKWWVAWRRRQRNRTPPSAAAQAWARVAAEHRRTSIYEALAPAVATLPATELAARLSRAHREGLR